jgi:hypothetical protein
MIGWIVDNGSSGCDVSMNGTDEVVVVVVFSFNNSNEMDFG